MTQNIQAVSPGIDDHFRLPASALRLRGPAAATGGEGFFHFGPELICYGANAAVPVSPEVDAALVDCAPFVTAQEQALHLPFDLEQVIGNLLFERYRAQPSSGWPLALLNRAYYSLRPLLGVSVRKHLQRIYLRDWRNIRFPAWPLDCTVDELRGRILALAMRAEGIEELPFVWFWPRGHQACAIVTHDVEGPAGVSRCSAMMDVDEQHGIRSAFQIVPEGKYPVSAEFLAEFRNRGFEINVHDLHHDGSLFRDHASFLAQVEAINRYVAEFGARGFRAGTMARRAEWIGSIAVAYDMSVPNVAHLEPQRGGCCTVFPYFIGDVLELPLTLTQDYALFHLMKSWSLDLWRQQLDAVRSRNGLISVLTHPDYLESAREQQLCRKLLQMLCGMRDQGELWLATPGEVNDWWRLRRNLQPVREGGEWRIAGPGAEQASLAYACLNGDQVSYRMERRLATCR